MDNTKGFDTTKQYNWYKFHKVNKNEAILWARNIFDNPEEYLVVSIKDTKRALSEIIDIAILGVDGYILYESGFSTLDNYEFNINKNTVLGKTFSIGTPTFKQEFKNLILLENKILITWNRKYDLNTIRKTIAMNNLPSIQMCCESAMDNYARFIGDWMKDHQRYSRENLPNAGQTALDDCYIILCCLVEMANSEIE